MDYRVSRLLGGGSRGTAEMSSHPSKTFGFTDWGVTLIFGHASCQQSALMTNAPRTKDKHIQSILAITIESMVLNSWSMHAIVRRTAAKCACNGCRRRKDSCSSATTLMQWEHKLCLYLIRPRQACDSCHSDSGSLFLHHQTCFWQPAYMHVCLHGCMYACVYACACARHYLFYGDLRCCALQQNF